MATLLCDRRFYGIPATGRDFSGSSTMAVTNGS